MDGNGNGWRTIAGLDMAEFPAGLGMTAALLVGNGAVAIVGVVSGMSPEQSRGLCAMLADAATRAEAGAEPPRSRLWRDLVARVGLDQANRDWPGIDPERTADNES
jgi:hypothetical protein